MPALVHDSAGITFEVADLAERLVQVLQETLKD